MTYHPSLQLAMFTVALGCGAIGAVTDLRTRRIPNLLTGPAMLIGLTLHLAIGGWKECATSLIALLVCGAVFLVFNLAGGMGAGDVKFIAAEACLLGLPNAGTLLLCTALSGGVLALGLALKSGKLRQTLQNVLVLTRHHREHGVVPHPELNVLNSNTLRLPYALAIAAGCLITLLLQPSSGLNL